MDNGRLSVLNIHVFIQGPQCTLRLWYWAQLIYPQASAASSHTYLCTFSARAQIALQSISPACSTGSPQGPEVLEWRFELHRLPAMVVETGNRDHTSLLSNPPHWAQGMLSKPYRSSGAPFIL